MDADPLQCCPWIAVDPLRRKARTYGCTNSIQVFGAAPRIALASHPPYRLGDDGQSGDSTRLVWAIGPVPGVAYRRPLRHLRQQGKGEVMRRGLFALPIPVVVLLAYNAVVLLGGDPTVTLP